ncbi:MAG: hypothetical protein ACRC0L_00450, partial [Angustibacter sp.]
VEIIGGTISADAVNGVAAANGPADYGINATGASRFAIRGATIGQSYNGMSAPTGAPSFFEMTDVTVEWMRADFCQMSGPHHFLFDNIYSRNGVLRGEKILWFNNGTLPVDGAPNTSNNVTSFYTDTDHSDFFQIIQLLGNTDFRLNNVNIEWIGQGITNFGPNNDGGLRDIWTRAEVTNCRLLCTDPWAIVAEGADLLIDNNIIGTHPTVPGDFDARLQVTRNPVDGRVRGGRTTVLTGGVISPLSGVDFTSATVNGDTGLVPPSLPNLHRLPWAPTPVRPAFVPYTGAPECVVPPAIFHTSLTPPANPTSGVHLTLGLGKWKGYESTTFEVQWKKNGAVIGGASARVLQATGVAGDSFVGEIRGTNVNGTGAWKPSAAVVLA